MSTFTRVAQGIQTIVTCTVVDSAGDPIDFSASAPSLAAEVWPGSTLPVTFSPAAAWNDAAAGTIDVTFSAASTAAVLPGFFQLRIRASDSSVWLWQGFAEIVASPSSAVALADLCTVPYAHAALSAQPFSDDEWQFLPHAIKSASDVIRRWCSRVFTRQSYSETLTPELDGSVRLSEIPVAVVTRVAGSPSDALTIACSSSINQQARVVFAASGNSDDPGGVAVTGLTLTRVASGVTTEDTLLFADYPLLSDMAAAINALPGGWSATVAPTFGRWLCSELIGGETARGCLAGEGAVLQVNAEDLSILRTDYRAGFVWVGAQQGSGSGAFGRRWGYDWASWMDNEVYQSPVRVTYTAGFDPIPESIQAATASLAKQFILRFRQNPLLKSESAHQYSYTVGEMVRTLSDADVQSLNLYRVHNA